MKKRPKIPVGVLQGIEDIKEGRTASKEEIEEAMKSDSTMDEEAENFVEAAQNDEYAEYELEPGFVLITDWEGDGDFLPYVVLPDGFDDNGKVTNLIDEEAGHFMDFESLDIAEQNHLTFAHLHRAELTVE